MRRLSLLCALAVLAQAQEGHACGPKRMHRKMHHAACIQPTALAQPVAYPQPMYAQAAPAPVAVAAAPAVVPTYEYRPGQADQPAYYYSYDESGKLIVTQWMDWLFRGGKEAGMPRPPLPVVGLLRNN